MLWIKLFRFSNVKCFVLALLVTCIPQKLCIQIKYLPKLCGQHVSIIIFTGLKKEYGESNEVTNRNPHPSKVVNLS